VVSGGYVDDQNLGDAVILVRRHVLANTDYRLGSHSVCHSPER
jgi:hypothetical protein